MAADETPVVIKVNRDTCHGYGNCVLVAEELFDLIFLNGSRAAAVELRRAQELRRLLPPAQLARLVVEQR